MRSFGEPETNPAGAKTPPRPPAPPTTGVVGPGNSSGHSGRGFAFAIRGTRVLVLGILAIALAAWLWGPLSVVPALATAACFLAFLPRFQLLMTPLLVAWLGMVSAAIIGCLVWGNGSVGNRVLGGLVTGFSVVSSATVLAVYRWDRARYRRASA